MKEIHWRDPRDGVRWTIGRVGSPPDRVYLVFWSVSAMCHLLWTDPRPLEGLSDGDLVGLLERALKGPWTEDPGTDAKGVG